VCGWTTEDASGETALLCRLVDGSSGEITARWTDLPWRVEQEPVVGALGSPAGWRLLLARVGRLRERRPCRRRASAENGGAYVGTARARVERGERGTGGCVGDAAAGAAVAGGGAVGASVGAAGGRGAR